MHWKKIVAAGMTAASDLKAAGFKWDLPPGIDTTLKTYPMFITPYVLSLIKAPFDPVWRQAIPDPAETEDSTGMADPLAEEQLSAVENLIQRYPDRALFLISDRCALYCRFCTRKRKIGRNLTVTRQTIDAGLDYIRSDKRIKDVLLSGGDPFLLSDDALCDIISAVRRIPHVSIIRIGTRTPSVLPQRITGRLASRLKKFHPLYVNTHFNHPDEITPPAALACRRLSDAGIPLGCQTVLLKGVNDSAPVMKDLMEKLLSIRVKPYYLHHPDLTRGTAHFRSPIRTGIEIIKRLRGHTSGLCVPHYVVDLPGGKGKVAFTPENLQSVSNGHVTIKNHLGDKVKYPVCKADEEAMKHLLGYSS